MSVRPHVDRFRPSDYRQPKKEETLSHFAATDKLFLRACAMANAKPSRRQASKFRRGMGSAANKVSEAAQSIVRDEAL